MMLKVSLTTLVSPFQYLTQLDMSENSIEFLDLSALDKIESVQCCKNQIKELTLNGRVLNSLVASNNSKLSKFC